MDKKKVSKITIVAGIPVAVIIGFIFKFGNIEGQVKTNKEAIKKVETLPQQIVGTEKDIEHIKEDIKNINSNFEKFEIEQKQMNTKLTTIEVKQNQQDSKLDAILEAVMK